MEFAGFFEVLHGQEVFPVGEVLHGGDAVGEGVGDGYFEGAAASSCEDGGILARMRARAGASRMMPVGSPLAS